MCSIQVVDDCLCQFQLQKRRYLRTDRTFEKPPAADQSILRLEQQTRGETPTFPHFVFLYPSSSDWTNCIVYFLDCGDQSAIYLAAIERRALVSGYLAETMCSLNIPLNQTYEKGNTIIHYLAIWGDEFNDVLRYLVRIRTADNKPAFDLNARNHTGTAYKSIFLKFEMSFFF